MGKNECWYFRCYFAKPKKNLTHQRDGIWNLHHPRNVSLSSFYTLSIYPPINPLILSALQSESACQGRAETLASDEQIASNVLTFYLYVCVSVCICVDGSISSCLLLFQAVLLWLYLPACCSTWGFQAMSGDSWHGFEYMCFWKDKLSYVSNVSAPPRLQAAPHIWQIT